MILALVVAGAGAVGAGARYLLDGFVQDRTSGVFPFGTLTVNVLGSCLLGLLTALALHHVGSEARTILGVGFCGGLTTWSTATWETVRLVEEGELRTAREFVLANLGVSLAAGALPLMALAYSVH